MRARQDLCRLWVQQKTSKGVTVRQVLASFRQPCSFFPSDRRSLLLPALAIGLRRRPRLGARTRKYAAIVVDANTGKTLFSANADAPRYPASLTKMMTLYLIFEALAARQDQEVDPGAVLRSTPRRSRRPSSASRPAVRSASRRIIYSLVTKSANDFGGGARRAHRRLGRRLCAHDDGQGAQARHDRHAVPERLRPAQPGQHSTARDMAILGLALREHFPQYYALFLDALLQLWPPAHGQPQPPARPRQGRRRHQDRLHARLRLQPRFVGEPTATAASSPS